MVYIPLEQANKGFQVLFNLPNAAHQEMYGKEGQEATDFLSQLIYSPCILSLLLLWSLQQLIFPYETAPLCLVTNAGMDKSSVTHRRIPVPAAHVLPENEPCCSLPWQL